MTEQPQPLVYVGTYTHEGEAIGREEGVYIYEFDPADGDLRKRSAITGIDNPSYLTLSADGRTLFTVNEVDEFIGVPGGGVSSFAVNREALQATLISSQPVHGTAPCYITLDPTGKWALVANYGGGSVTVLPVGSDGRLGAASAVIRHRGHSVIPDRQDAPHSHCVVFDQSQRFVLVADLGLDQILIFRLDADTGQLVAHDPPSASTAPGAGPRHLAFHPNNRYLYVTNELDSTIAVYAFDADRGRLEQLQVLSLLPEGYGGAHSAADIHIAPSGRFVYASNRGPDSIAVFAIDPASGRLTLVEMVPSGGRTPRNFSFDLTGAYLLVANQGSGDLVVFRVDSQSGRLTPTGTSVNIPAPTCVKVIAGI